MALDFKTPKVPSPLRTIIFGAAMPGWFEASDQDRREKILPRFKEMTAEWSDIGAKLITTVDDDLFMVGPPGAPDFTFYLVFEVPSLDALAAMIHCLRISRSGVRLDRYFRLEARVGRPFFLLEDEA